MPDPTRNLPAPQPRAVAVEGPSGVTEGPVRLRGQFERCIFCPNQRSPRLPLCWLCVDEVLAYDGDPETDALIASWR